MPEGFTSVKLTASWGSSVAKGYRWKPQKKRLSIGKSVLTIASAKGFGLETSTGHSCGVIGSTLPTEKYQANSLLPFFPSSPHPKPLVVRLFPSLLQKTGTELLRVCFRWGQSPGTQRSSSDLLSEKRKTLILQPEG